MYIQTLNTNSEKYGKKFIHSVHALPKLQTADPRILQTQKAATTRRSCQSTKFHGKYSRNIYALSQGQLAAGL